MLPFLQPKRVAGLVIEKRRMKEDGSVVNADSDNSGIESCAEELLRAISSKDAQAVAQALRSAFEILSSESDSEEESETDEEIA